MLALDLNKTALSYMERNRGDYLVLDAGCCRNLFLKLHLKGRNETYYCSDIQPDRLNTLLASYGESMADVELISFADIEEEEFDSAMERFLAEILRLYDEEHIILTEIRPEILELNDFRFGLCDQYYKAGVAGKAMKRGWDYFRAKIPRAHIIEFPKGVWGNHNHKWGSNYLHYVPEYYDYGLKAIDIITQGQYPREQERRALFDLKQDCEVTLQNKYAPVIIDYFKTYLNMEDDADGSVLFAHPGLTAYIKARIDIKNEGTEENDLEIMEISDPKADISKPGWFAANGVGYVIQSVAGSLLIKVSCRGSGVFKVSLRGMDIRDRDGKRIPYKIDFTGLHINGSTFFNDKQCIWHDHPYKYTQPVQNGEEIALSVTWTVHDERLYSH